MEEKNRICTRGYAKINLHLDITGKMPDGYHQVKTVMQSVSLYDEIVLYPHAEKGFDAECNVPNVPSDERNLAVRAALLYGKVVGISWGGHIVIRKQIPMAAGMAGGSADAAAVLRGMNRSCGYPLSTDALCRLGAELGADVPFCIMGGTAYAEGKGDILSSVSPLPSCWLVVACEGEGVSTPWAYGLLDSCYKDFKDGCGYCPHPVEPLLHALDRGDLLAAVSSFYNIFETSVLDERPIAKTVYRILQEQGAIGTMMSGSGPSVFGVFTDRQTANSAFLALQERGYAPYLCQPVGMLDEPDKKEI